MNKTCHFLMNLIVSFVWIYDLWSYDCTKNKQCFQFDLLQTSAVLEIQCICAIFCLKRGSVLSSLFTWWDFGAGNIMVFMTISGYYLLPMVKPPKSVLTFFLILHIKTMDNSSCVAYRLSCNRSEIRLRK